MILFLHERIKINSYNLTGDDAFLQTFFLYKFTLMLKAIKKALELVSFNFLARIKNSPFVF